MSAVPVSDAEEKLRLLEEGDECAVVDDEGELQLETEDVFRLDYDIITA